MNQKWLQYTSIPEVARLLQYPPYKYHSIDFTFDSLNLSTPNSENDGFFWDTINDNDNHSKCSDDVIQVLLNLESQWALQMLDSDGKLSSGILRGGLIWPGHYKECLNVYAPLDEDGHGDFHGQYCVSSWTVDLNEQYSNLPLTIGLCVPDSCSGNGIKTAMKNASYILDRIPVLKQLKSHLTLNKVVCKAKEISYDAPAILYLFIISIFITLSVLGSSLTVYDTWKSNVARRNHLMDNISTQSYGTLQTSEGSINNSVDAESQMQNRQSDVTSTKGVSGDRTILVRSTDVQPRSIPTHTQQPVSVLKRILLCFSIFANGQKILSTDKVDGQLLSIHGIRFLSLSWVIMGHSYISSVSIISNRLDVLEDMDTFPFQMLLQSPFSVDSFFLLSGFLLTYLFLKEATKKDGKISWLYFYIHRIWRLTPSYVIVVFFYMLIFKYLGSGPFWDDNHCDANRNSWWQYLLYLNNFIPIHDMCVGWSWYLANDMQFYLISPLFLYPLWKWPKAGFGILGAFLLATWTTTGIMSYTYDLIPMFVGVIHTQNFTAYEKRMWDSFDLIYDKPYCRIAPYIIGAILAYILYKTAERRNFLNWWQQLLGWAVAAFCSLSVVFGLYHVEMDTVTAMFYNALCRSSFVIGLAWLIYACETGHGGFLTKFLSWKLWIPLSRLTYSAYLVHPILIHGYYQAYPTSLYFTQLTVVTNFLGFLLTSYGLAFAFSLVFESPFMNLEKLVVKQKTK